MNTSNINELDRLRIEYVVFNKLYNIVKNRQRLPRGLLLIGPRSVGKSFILNRLLSLFLMHNINIDIIRKCLNNKFTGNRCDIINKLIDLTNYRKLIPLFYDCRSNSDLSIEYVDNHARMLLGSSNYDKYIILLLIDNIHFCYNRIHKFFDSFFARDRVIIVAASPTAHRPRELKRSEFESVRFYPLRFGEISINLLNYILENKNINNFIPLKGSERRTLIANPDKLLKKIESMYNSLYTKNNIKNILLALFALYSVFGGTITGYNILTNIIKKIKRKNNIYVCKNENIPIFENAIRSYVDALRKTYHFIIDDAMEVGKIDDMYKPYVEATFQILAKSVFEDYNITFSGDDIKRKAIELGDYITLSTVNKNKAQNVVQKTLEYLRDADILFQIKAYKLTKNNEYNKDKKLKHKYVYSDPRYLYAAYYGYLLHIPYDSIHDPSSLVIKKLKEILLSIACMDHVTDTKDIKFIGIFIELITLQNIMLNLYGIRASADKPKDPQPAGYGLYTYRMEAPSIDKKSFSEKKQNNKQNKKCQQFEIDALIVKNGKLFYGIEISRSQKKVDELLCAINFAKNNNLNILFNIYLRSNIINKKSSSIFTNKGNLRIIYVPLPLFLLVTT